MSLYTPRVSDILQCMCESSLNCMVTVSSCFACIFVLDEDIGYIQCYGRLQQQINSANIIVFDSPKFEPYFLRQLSYRKIFR